ncbi:hypothetical protein L5515_009297 [Caenorhabditis briggsae]|uniref:Uncharacterized protein n=1 Tax=Caenorhabditis briggsae TaxID=6238 RepID=A0AAE9FCI4_CAEBR|nr:hypothetical protein L5515_009297 [Caenorhabditis briggsae]
MRTPLKVMGFYYEGSREKKYKWVGPYGDRVYDTLCYIRKWIHTDETFGVLGSGCGTDFNVNGLCRSENLDFEESSVTTIYMNLLTKLNIERREYAKAMNIANMYKLVRTFILDGYAPVFSGVE